MLAAAEQAQQLRNRGIDLVIGRLATPFDADIEVETLFQERAFVVAGPGSPWVGRRHIRLADLIDEPWLLPPLDTVIGVLIAEAFASSGLQLPRGAVISTSTQL